MKVIKGKVQPLEVEEKINIGVKKALSEHPVWSEKAIWATAVREETYNTITIGENKARHTAKGTCLLNFKRHRDGAILPSAESKFSITIEDCKDQYGLPDVKVTQAKFSALPE